jgi:hypothetical protein
MSEITPEKVAASIASYSGELDEDLGGWTYFEAHGGTLTVKVTLVDENGDEDKTNPKHFRAVVEGEQTPLVLDRSVFERRVNERFNHVIRKMASAPTEVWPAHIGALREQILNLDVDLSEAAQAEQKGGQP